MGSPTLTTTEVKYKKYSLSYLLCWGEWWCFPISSFFKVFLCGVCDFKNTKIKVTYSTRNTLKKLLMGKHHNSPQQSVYERSGIYQTTCPTCNMKYTGQTGRLFNTRFREHLRDIKNGYGKSRYLYCILYFIYFTSVIVSVRDPTMRSVFFV